MPTWIKASEFKWVKYKKYFAKTDELIGTGWFIPETNIFFWNEHGFENIEKKRYHELFILDESPTVDNDEWISVRDERKPKEDEWALCCVGNNIIVDGMYQYVDGGWIPYNHYEPDTRITHWLPLPQPPTS